MIRYRWLRSDGVLVYVGRARPEWKGRRGRLLVAPRPGVIGNVLVEFVDGERVTAPAGCFRMEENHGRH